MKTSKPGLDKNGKEVIRNLRELRYVKNRLKREMNSQTKDASENNFIVKAVSGIISKFRSDNSFTSSGVQSSLNFVSNKASSKFNLSPTTQKVISGIVVVLTPIIARQIQKYIQNKFS